MNLGEEKLKLKGIEQPMKKKPQGAGFIDLQYQICSTFLMNTCQKLSKQELRIMAETNKLIDTLQQSKAIERQNETTENSQICEHSCNMPSFRNAYRLNSENSQNKVIARKSPIGHTKYLSSAYSDEIKEIEENCTSKTTKSIKRLIEEYKRLKDILAEMDIRQKKQQRKIEKLEAQEQKLIMLRKVEQYNERKIKKLQAKINELKNNPEDLQKMKETQELIDPKMVQKIVIYLNQKERLIGSKMKRVQEIEQNILKVIKDEIKDEGCEKCCSFLKKIKEFVIKFKQSLQVEGEEIERMYNRYKNELYESV